MFAGLCQQSTSQLGICSIFIIYWYSAASVNKKKRYCSDKFLILDLMISLTSRTFLWHKHATLFTKQYDNLIKMVSTSVAFKLDQCPQWGKKVLLISWPKKMCWQDNTLQTTGEYHVTVYSSPPINAIKLCSFPFCWSLEFSKLTIRGCWIEATDISRCSSANTW